MDMQFLAFSAFDRLRRVLPKLRTTVLEESRVAFSASCIKGSFGFNFQKLQCDTLDLSDTDIFSVPMTSFRDSTTTKWAAVLLQLCYYDGGRVRKIYLCSKFGLTMVEGQGCTCCITSESVATVRDSFRVAPCPVHHVASGEDTKYKLQVY